MNCNDKIKKNKNKIEEYIQNKECQNQIFHLANYFNVDIKEMIMILNDNKIKLCHYRITKTLFYNDKINETFKQFNEEYEPKETFENIVNYDIHKKINKFNNVKFWLEINGFPIKEELDNKRFKNIDELINKNILDEIKKDINNGKTEKELKEQYKELKKWTLSWNRWFEKENINFKLTETKLDKNENISDSLKKYNEKEFIEFKKKYSNETKELIKKGKNINQIKKIMNKKYKGSKRFFPIEKLLKDKEIKAFYNEFEKIRKIKSDERKRLKKQFKQNSNLLFQKNNEKQIKDFFNYSIQKSLNTKNQLKEFYYSKDLNKIISFDMLESIYLNCFNYDIFILKENVFSLEEINRININNLNVIKFNEKYFLNKNEKQIIKDYINKTNFLEKYFKKIENITHFNLFFRYFIAILKVRPNELDDFIYFLNENYLEEKISLLKKLKFEIKKEEKEKIHLTHNKNIYLNKIKEIDSIWEPINIDDFCDMNTRFPHKCKLCGNIRNILPKHNIKKDKKLTCFCNGGPKTDEENLIFAKEICEEMNYKFIDIFYDIDKNGKKEKKIKFECPKHGSQTINFKRFKKGQRCGYCTSENKSTESSGERRIRLILTKFNILFLQEYRLDDSLLRYDFYLPDYNLLIEFDGIQHFEEVAFFASKEKSKEELKYKQNNDKRKNQLAKEKNINLLRIPYYDFDNILEILIENLNKYGKQELNVEKIDINLINSIKKEIEEEEKNIRLERLKNISPKMKNKNKKISESLKRKYANQNND